MKLTTSLFATLAVIASASANAALPGDPEAGAEKSQTCAACHGPTGNSENPIYPIIAGQYRDYIEHALKEYRSGARNNAIMRGLASGLSDQDILDLSAYYSRQESKLRTPKPE